MNPSVSLACGFLTATGFGTADFVAKLSTTRVGFLRTALFMQIIGSFFVLPFALTDIPLLFVHPWATLGGILVGVANAIATLSLYKGFEVGRLSIVSPIASTAPVISILLAVVFLHEIVTSELLLAISLVIGGIIIVSFQTDESKASKQVASGVAYAICFMLFGGLLLFGLKPVSAVLGVFLPVLIMRWVGIPVLAVPFFASRHGRMQRRALQPITAIAFFDTFANVTYTLGVKYGTVTIVSTLGGMFSAVTVLLAWAILRERLSRHHVLGFLCIVLGVAVLSLTS